MECVRRYYQLEISYFKSSCDTALLNAIWNKYWIATLSASPLLSNAPYISAQMKDIADKLESAEGGLSHFGRGGGGGSYLMGAERSKKDDTQLKKIVRDAGKVTRPRLTNGTQLKKLPNTIN